MFGHQYTTLRAVITGLILLIAMPAFAAEKPTAVVFLYQQVGEDTGAEGNISTEQFREHLNELKKGGYAVLPLSTIVDALKSNAPLPPKAVAITFDGAWAATLANAVPLLQKAQMPYTVFFSSDALDGNRPERMSWSELKKLKKDGLASYGLLPATYAHMVDQTPEENAALINRAVSRMRDMLGETPAFFAYPYGEYDAAVKKQLSAYSFKAVFGQQSGVAHGQSDFLSLPRFTMTNEYGDLDRFMLTANATPLPVTDVVPEDTLITRQNPPTIGFTVGADVKNISKLSCFASNVGKLPLMKLSGNRVEIRPTSPFTDRRTRINCTLPDGTKRWRWFGMMMILPTAEEEVSDTPAADDSTE